MVVDVIHPLFRYIKNTIPRCTGLLQSQLDSRRKYFGGHIVWFCSQLNTFFLVTNEPHVNTIVYILDCFPKHRIIHKFQEVVLEVITSLCSQPSVQIYTRLQPCVLFEFNTSINLSYP